MSHGSQTRGREKEKGQPAEGQGGLLILDTVTLSAPGVFLIEPFDPSFGIDQFGIAGVEGMTVSAGVHVHFGTGRTGFGHRATGAMDFGVHIFGVKISFHRVLLKLIEGWVL
jgi:hypothetical protein